MKLAWTLMLLFAATVSVWAEVERFSWRMNAGEKRDISVPWALDDTSFREPRGYVAKETQRVWHRRTRITNVGQVPITGHLIQTFGVSFAHGGELAKTIMPDGFPKREKFFRAFNFWCAARSHATSGLPINGDPIAVLNYFGYTLCGDDVQAIARWLKGMDIPSRYVHMNGHVVGEYFFDDSWHVMDGDQNTVYLRWDSRTAASAADIRADPLLAVRTKVFGRFWAYSQPHSVYNTALFEHVAPEKHKHLDDLEDPIILPETTLYPGESLIYHHDQSPEVPVGITDLGEWKNVRQSCLSIVELQVQPKHRGLKAGEVTVSMAWPILEIQNLTTGKTVVPDLKSPTFTARIEASAEDRVIVKAQCNRGSLSQFRAGITPVQLRANAGTAEITLEAEPFVVDVPKIAVEDPQKPFPGSPVFRLNTQNSRPERIWWQISGAMDFSLIPPSWNEIADFQPELRLHPLAETYFRHDSPFRIRVRGYQNGVWGPWSEPMEFRVSKPAQPRYIQVKHDRLGKMRIIWPAETGVEYLVFGSNRIDFVPEVFTDTEIVKLAHITVMETRKNQNLIGTTTSGEFVVEPKHRYFRIIGRKAGALSIPSELIPVHPKLANNVPAGKVLQARPDPDGEGKFLVTELPLTPEARVVR